MPALSIATSVPVPIAIPTAASASAGASLMPSPAIATTAPRACSSRTTSRFPRRQHFGVNVGGREAERAPTASAVSRASPVSITMRSPSRAERVERLARVGLDRIGDGDDPGEPSVDGDVERPSAPAARCAATRASAADASTPRCAHHRGVAQHDVGLPTRPRTPCPVVDSKVASGGSVRRARLRGARRWRRRADARCPARARRRGAGPRPRRAPNASIATTSGRPSVSVPVLSTTIVSTFSSRSSASACFTSTPSDAPRPVPTMIAIGVARPSAHGHAMISTATAADERVRQPRLRSPERPADERRDRDGNDERHEPARRCDRPAAAPARASAAPRRPSGRSARAACRARRAPPS